MRRLPTSVVLVAVSLASGAAVAADLSHSGYLLGANDLPENRTLSMSFTISNAPTTVGETQYWSATCDVPVNAGYYTVLLGSGGCGGALPTTVTATALPLYLAVQVGNVPLAPRHLLAPVTRATYADVANTLTASTLSLLVSKSELGTLPLAPTGTASSTTYLRGDGKWVVPPTNTGPAGPAGADGAPGPQGIQGIQGPQGPQGPAGTNGTAASLAVLDGIQRPCPTFGVQTFTAATTSWSACPTQWNCTTTPTHAGCVSSSQYRSCKAIKDDVSFIGGTGNYYIDPDGASNPIAPLSVWCDMATDSGGWTLIVRITVNQIHHGCAEQGTLVNPTQGAAAKLADATINALGASVYRMDCGTVITYWDATQRNFNACTANAVITRGKNSLAEAFRDLSGDQAGRGFTANDNSVGGNAYYGYPTTNGCHNGAWSNQGYVLAR